MRRPSAKQSGEHSESCLSTCSIRRGRVNNFWAENLPKKVGFSTLYCADIADLLQITTPVSLGLPAGHSCGGLVHAYRATGLPSANQGAASSRDPVFRKRRLSGILGSHPAPAEKGLGVPSPCLEVLPGLQSPCECGLSDPETRGSFRLRCHKR
jgi:hypothetical protein